MVEFEVGKTMENSPKRLTAAVFFVSTGTLCIGSVLGWTSPALQSITKSNLLGELNWNQKSWIASSVLVGAIFGYPLASIMLGRLGRRITLLALSVTLILAWIVMSCSSSLITLELGRAISGLSAEGIATIIPIYVNEISSKDSPRFFKYLHLVFCEVGILLSFIIGGQVDWLWFSVLCGMIPMIFICCMVYIPETPHYFLALGKYRSAQKALTWLKGPIDNFEINQDLSEMKLQLEEEGLAPRNPISFKEFLKPDFVKVIGISACLVFLQLFSGMPVLIFYTHEILDTFLVQNIVNNYLSSVFVLSSLVLGMIIGTLVIDGVKKSKIYLCISCVGTSTFMAILAVCFRFVGEEGQEESEIQNNIVTNWIGFISLSGFASFYGIGLALVPWMTMDEITPTKYRGWIFGIITSFKWILAFLVIQFFQDSFKYLGQGVFWIFSGLNLLGFLFSYLVLSNV